MYSSNICHSYLRFCWSNSRWFMFYFYWVIFLLTVLPSAFIHDSKTLIYHIYVSKSSGSWNSRLDSSCIPIVKSSYYEYHISENTRFLRILWISDWSPYSCIVTRPVTQISSQLKLNRDFVAVILDPGHIYYHWCKRVRQALVSSSILGPNSKEFSGFKGVRPLVHYTLTMKWQI